MSDPYWENLKEIFHATLALAPEQRAAYLEQVCHGNSSLLRAVESLIRSHESSNFVDTPVYRAAAEMLVDRLDFKRGQILAHYRILSLLGEGGMGKVYLAEDTKLNRKVSLKFLSSNFTLDHERLRRFEQEARAASALNHPNILTIHDTGETEGHRFISTEFIEGQTLRERLQSGLDIEDALDIAIQVASALVAAHRVNIIHRDIKPENIMIRSDDGLVKILDFGLAKMSIPGRVASGLLDREAETWIRADTAPGVVMGTVAYMSPEQARGDTIDERTDIWSLGVVLYEMIAGCSPFAAGTSNEIISGILSKMPPPPLARYSRLVPERLEEIVKKTLTKNRDERYQTSKDLLIDLKHLKQSVELKASMERTDSSGKLEAKVSANRVRTTLGTDSENTKAQAGFSTAYVLDQFNRHKISLSLGLAVLLLTVVASAIIYSRRARPNGAPAEVKSLAILPLKSLDSEQNYLAIGIADAVIQRISQTGQLTVRPTSAVLKFAKEDTDSLSAAAQLNADAILEGTVQHAGNRLRVSVNLLRASDGSSMWADNFDFTVTDIFAIEDKVAQQVATRLQLHLDATQTAALNRSYPTSPVAYEFYVKGIYGLDERGYDMPQMQTTIGFFKRAIDVDPKYAPAHAQLARAYIWTAMSIESGEQKWAELARQEIQQAEELAPKLAETHVANALLLWSAYGGYQIDVGIRELLLAKQLNPNWSGADLAAMYGHIGLEDQAERELQRALNIDPTSQSLKELIHLLPFLAGRADEWFAARQKVDPIAGSPMPWYLLRKGRLDEAQVSIEERLARAHNDDDLLMQQALLLALRGNFPEAEERVRRILSRIHVNDEARHHSTYDAACVFALAGDTNDAVKLLRETAATGFANYPLFERDVFLNRIRQAPGFVQFMAEQKAQWEKYSQEFGG